MIFCILGFILSFLSAPLFTVSEMATVYVNGVINRFGSWKYSTVITPKWTAFLFIGVIIMVLWVLIACKVRLDVVKSNEINAKRIKEGGRIVSGNNFGTGFKKRN